jgi:hypothetical protein
VPDLAIERSGGCTGYSESPSVPRTVLYRYVTIQVTVHSLIISGRLNDGTELGVDLSSPKAVILAFGGKAALSELGEQLAWLGAALRDSPESFGVWLATPTIAASVTSRDVVLRNQPSIQVQLKFTVSSLAGHSPSKSDDGTCWHALFRNPVIVNGFPILVRPKNQKGLEAPLDIMSTLAEAYNATHYDATLVLKGLCTAFIPTDRTDHSITWHFLYNEDGTWLPYYSSRERCPGWMSTDKVNLGLLDTGKTRNFVGWASNITRHLGTFPYIPCPPLGC